jgi:hypothetical protein
MDTTLGIYLHACTFICSLVMFGRHYIGSKYRDKDKQHLCNHKRSLFLANVSIKKLSFKIRLFQQVNPVLKRIWNACICNVYREKVSIFHSSWDRNLHVHRRKLIEKNFVSAQFILAPVSLKIPSWKTWCVRSKENKHVVL